MKQQLKRFRLVGIPILALLAVVDGFLIEPAWPKLVRHELALAGLASPVKVALLADPHTKEVGARERRVLAMLEREKPDLILIAGDLANGSGRPADAVAFLKELHAPLGVIVVPGNWDYWRGGRGAGLAEYAATGAVVLRDEVATPREDLAVAGLDDTLAGNPQPDAVIASAPEGRALVVLMHEPGLFDHMSGHVPLALAGHTHGGQGRIPFVGAPYTPPGSGRFVEGWYARGESRMYVSRGLGTSIIPARVWCRPEVTILELRPQPETPNK